MQLNKNKKIGIWGYGITGKAAVNFLASADNTLMVYDKKTIPQEEVAFLQTHNVAVYKSEDLDVFLEDCDYILPSPGIDLLPYKAYGSKWLNELDLFSAAWRKPIIAITGSVGKTTITHLLSLLLDKSGKQVATGGNIGTPMFDLFALQEQSDMALLEVSSFQLEYTKSFEPTLAIWTNFYPNHLDRHGSELEYKKAKAKLLAFQNANQQALIPLELKDFVNAQSIAHYFAKDKPSDELASSLSAHQSVYYFESDALVRIKNKEHAVIARRSELPAISYEENWLIIVAALDLLGISMPQVTTQDLSLPEHRLEHIATISDIDFYNDSKSTTPQSTLAAVNRLNKHPILLLLGGVSKGVDRTPLIQELAGNVQKIYCFGKEADQLKILCDAQSIISESYKNLDDAFNACVKEAHAQDQIVLSPSGASFDLFANYMERGAYFKKLVNDLTHKK
jgi:UDP-N-acetylmuramoylalanine--D-glutamate ligase